MVLGSFIPLGMYIAWVYACLGGGIDTNISMDNGWAGAVMTIFSVATLCGSCIGGGLSLMEEWTNLVGKPPKVATVDTEMAARQTPNVKQSLPTALLSVSMPLTAALYFSMTGGDMTAALSIAGGVGSPLLYGVIPALMAWNQRQAAVSSSTTTTTTTRTPLVPTAGLGALGLLSSGFVGEEVMQRVESVFALL
jgi:tyrosine-specific transport protein